MENGPVPITRFKGYTASFTTKERSREDSQKIFDLIDRNGRKGDNSRKQAVYVREKEIVDISISNGLFVKIEDRTGKLVALTGAYPLEPHRLDETGSVRHRLVEIGTLVSEPRKADSDGKEKNPQHCFAKFLIESTVLNVLSLAEREIGTGTDRRMMDFDRIICNVQLRLKWLQDLLTSEELGWIKMDELEAGKLDEICAKTVSNKKTFEADKHYYQYQTTSTPHYAEYLSGCIKQHEIVGDVYKGEDKKLHRDIVGIDINFEPRLIEFINSPKENNRR